MTKYKECYIEAFENELVNVSLNICVLKKSKAIIGAVIVRVDDKVRYMPIIDKWDEPINLIKDQDALKYYMELVTEKERVAEIALKDEAYLLINYKGGHIGGTISEFIDALYCYRRLIAK